MSDKCIKRCILIWHTNGCKTPGTSSLIKAYKKLEQWYTVAQVLTERACSLMPNGASNANYNVHYSNKFADLFNVANGTYSVTHERWVACLLIWFWAISPHGPTFGVEFGSRFKFQFLHIVSVSDPSLLLVQATLHPHVIITMLQMSKPGFAGVLKCPTVVEG